DVKKQIEDAAADLEEKVKGEDAQAIQDAITKLGEVSQELGKAVYEKMAAEQQAAGGAAGGAAGAGAQDAGKDDDVIDAEYEVKE
ncbi:MAG: molecular chaperone DnaK, partial [Phycisphaeraceae bacterium JB051]